MPVLKRNRHLYPGDWLLISQRIRFKRAKGQCECTGQCGLDHGGRCAARHMVMGFWARHSGFWFEAGAKEAPPRRWGERIKRIILTTMHLDHDPTNNTDSNLMAGCQRCHNRYDRGHRAATRAGGTP